MISARTYLVTLLGISCGCSDGESGAPPVEICDGSDGLRFGARIPVPGLVAPDMLVRLELGYEFLFVDGHCRYWVLAQPNTGMHANWVPTRSGVLDQEKAARLSATFLYGQWRDLSGSWGITDVSHAPVTLFHDTQAIIQCIGACDRERPGLDAKARETFGRVSRIVRAFEPWLEDMYKAAQPTDGPLRVNVIRQNDDTFSLAAPAVWPAKEPIDRFINTTPLNELRPGNSTLMTDAFDVAALRALRDRLLRGDFAAYWSIPIERPGSEYPDLLSFRDATAIERADGLIPIP